MYLLLKLKNKILSALLLSGSVAAGIAAGALSRSGSEYRFLPTFPGDQVLAQVSFNSQGGYLVVQDNSIDGNGLGIRGRKYSADLSGSRTTFQVNDQRQGDQRNARVAMLTQGGAVFAWESSTPQGHRVFVRFMDSKDTFITSDVSAGDLVSGDQSDPALAALTDGTVLLVWAELDRDGSMKGIFAQHFSAAGAYLGGTVQVNQYSALDQRFPAVSALENGGFVIAWVSDENRHANSIDVYARAYLASGQPAGSEFRINNSEKICANPTLVAIPGGFRAAWSGREHQVNPDGGSPPLTPAQVLAGWDALTRVFDLQGKPLGDEMIVNNTITGDQYSPKMANLGNRQLVIWTSFGQDGADEGIYGRVVSSAGDFDGNEFLVNTRTISKQLYPAVAAVNDQTVTVVWSSFTGGLASYDLFAQNYQVGSDDTLPQPTSPFASALSQNTLCATWPEIVSQNVATYLIYVDDETIPQETSGGFLTIQRPAWLPSSTHTLRMAYRTVAGRVSSFSQPVSVTTWGADLDGDGLPDDWEKLNWGKHWPRPDEDSDQDGASNVEEFLAGTDPTNPNSILKIRMSVRPQGVYVEWNTEAGNYYQLEVTSDFKTWRNIGTPRFAPSTTDSLPATEAEQVRYYRVIRMR